MAALKVLGGGAAHALVEALTPAFSAATGLAVEGDYGAVGGMRARVVAGEAADLAILSRALVDDLVAAGLALDPVDVGVVETGIAFRAGDAAAPVGDADALRAALAAADAVYLPDPTSATAGIHFAGVIERLGLTAELAGRLRPHPNGASAMRALAASSDRRPIGCTQVTEILAVAGVTLAGPLPPGLDLATTYTAAPLAAARHPEAARDLARRLGGTDAAEARRRVGFSS
jgi:molybdate transport system substrate-binding protein